MVSISGYYPKLLAFLELMYPSLFAELAYYSNNSNLIEAKLIATNNRTSYRAVVFSEGDYKSGDVFHVTAETTLVTPYLWDWRWVFALNVLHKDEIILPIKFPQKIMALPVGENPISTIFFEHLSDEFALVIQNLIGNSNRHQKTIAEAYVSYLHSAHN